MRGAVCWLGLIAACGPARFVAQEDWAELPELRLVVLSSGGVVTAKLLDRDAPFDVSLGETFTGARSAQVWVLGYTLDALRPTFPALGNRSPAEVVSLLSPMIDGSEGAELPPTSGVLCGKIEAGGPAVIGYQACDWERWREGDIRVTLGYPRELVCGAVQAAQIPAPAGVSWAGIAAISGQEAMLVGTEGIDLVLFHLSGDTISRLDVVGRAPPRGRFSWDRTTQTVLGLDTMGTIIRRRADGTPVPIAPLDFLDGIWAGLDGTIVGSSYFLYSHEPEGWVQKDVGQTRAMELVRLARRSRGFAWTGCWINAFSLGQTGGATVIYDGQPCNNSNLISILDFDVDDDAVVAVGEDNRVASYTSGPVAEIGGALGQGALRAAAAVGAGRALVGGDRGALGFWTGREWCPLEADPALDFITASSAHDGRTAYAIAAQQVFRVTGPAAQR